MTLQEKSAAFKIYKIKKTESYSDFVNIAETGERFACLMLA